MAVSVTHQFVSAIPDGGDATVVQPSNWNDVHTVTGLGTAAEADTTDFATAAQGAKADTALQPAAIGVSVQPFDADLSAWAGVNPSSYSTSAQIAAAYQPLDTDLTTWAGLTPSANFQTLVPQTFAQMRASLDLEAGTDFLSPAAIAAAYQPLDGDLTSWAGVTRASGFDTFAATPSSANLRSLLTDETGSGPAFFVLNNLSASVSPTVNDDSGDGYQAGSRWVNTTLRHVWVCMDATLGAAVWHLTNPTRVFQSHVAVSHTGAATEATLATVTIPANTMGPNGKIRIQSVWSNNNSGNAKTSRIYWNGTGGTRFLNAARTTDVHLADERSIANRNSASSQLVNDRSGTGGFGTSTTAIATDTVNTTANVDVVFRGLLANSGDTITLESYSIEIIYGA